MRVALSTIAVCLLTQPAAADELMRCGNWLVSVPITVSELLSKCGEPAKKDVSTEGVRGATRGVIGTTTTEKWTYKHDNQSFPMVVTIVDRQVTRIEQKD